MTEKVCTLPYLLFYLLHKNLSFELNLVIYLVKLTLPFLCATEV